MNIRKATLSDSPFIAAYLMLAMEEIVYKFIGNEDYKQAKDFLQYFIEKEHNQYSYQNCLVAEDHNEVIAAVSFYDGAKLSELRAPVLEHLKTHFNLNIQPEDETKAGEYYIDSLGVNPNQQGRGIGTKLLKFLIKEYVTDHQQTLGLLVDEENPAAKKLYLKLGFKLVGTKTLLGKRLEHLQINFTDG